MFKIVEEEIDTVYIPMHCLNHKITLPYWNFSYYFIFYTVLFPAWIL